MRCLLEGKGAESKNLRDNIRSYNSALSFASFGAHIDLPPGFGPYCFKIHGGIYHQIGPLHPVEGEPPKYAQLYIVDAELAQRERMGQTANENCLPQVMDHLATQILAVNPFAKALRFMRDVERDEIDKAKSENRPAPQLRMVFVTDKDADKRRYNAPCVNEVAAVFVGDPEQMLDERQIIVYTHANQLTKISNLDKQCDPLVYTLLFPAGDYGWYPAMEKARKTEQRSTVTMLQFYAYRLAIRQDFSALHLAGKLFQQFIVDAYVKIEQSRLFFLLNNQKQLRCELYKGLMDYIGSEAEERGIPAGKVTILPSSFHGSDRNMQQNYQDAMAIVRKFGKPDLFITFTANPKWREIRENLLPNQTAMDRPDLVSRVFHMKCEQLIEDIAKGNIFGTTVAHIYVIEFQKRGLPHCHLLVILAEPDKPKTEEIIDKICNAEIPNPEAEPVLFERVKTHMIHGPCGDNNKNSPCMEGGKCSKGYPKEICNQTNANVDGYPQYKRRKTDFTAIVGRHQVDNSWVVPHNKYLLIKYNSHINVEVCTSFKAVKYLFKYVYKGHDCATVNIQQSITQDGQQNQQVSIVADEITGFLNARYVSAPESMWRILAFPLEEKSHSVVRLAVHMPLEQLVTFHTGDEAEAIQRAARKKTTLTAWFELNKTDPDARDILYPDIPEKYTFSDGNWHKRKG
ncbi:MAG: hypothetical protein GY696_40250, partial [Gammaproteobacteria bacterium]|nr:hypothetical protein [Gammaproteobacteria bacterium]